MDLIYGMLECHEKWLKECKEKLEEKIAIDERGEGWNKILEQIHSNLDAHEKHANILNMRDGHELTEQEKEDRRKMNMTKKEGVSHGMESAKTEYES
ncbi:MAG: hypothetical protein FWF50_01675 [Defluviitaleaceae bacterium]|nr:hypothetical protein [Defluviitaleaceae bacterium]